MKKPDTTAPPSKGEGKPIHSSAKGEPLLEKESKPEKFGGSPRHKQLEILLQLLYLGLKVAESAAGLLKDMI